jgi:protein-tyrosine-phosphatase
MKKKLLYLCSGNTCRSPLAWIFTRELMGSRQEEWTVESAGLYVHMTAPASKHARLVAEEYGLDLSMHKSRPISQHLLAEADLVLVMTENHRDTLRESTPQFTEKIFTLKEFAGLAGDVSDPFGGGAEQYRQTARELRELVLLVAEKLSD